MNENSKKLDVKLIALDLDDTLLNHHLQITPRTVAALQKAASNGIYIVLCSGRAENAILPYVRQLNIAGLQAGRYLIAVNGASIFDLHTRMSIYTQKLSGEILNFVYKEATLRGLPTQVYDPTTIYASVDNEWTQVDAKLCGLNLKIVDDFESFLNQGHPKMIVPAEPEQVQKFMPFLKERLEGVAEVFISKPYFLEIMPADCGKGQSILRLAEKLGIPQTKTMAFGDSMNDESMMQRVQYSVAMSNGLDHIKKISKYVTRLSNEEDGIADFLEEYVF